MLHSSLFHRGRTVHRIAAIVYVFFLTLLVNYGFTSSARAAGPGPAQCRLGPSTQDQWDVTLEHIQSTRSVDLVSKVGTNIVLTAHSSVPAGALDALARAESQWEALLGDPVSVPIFVQFLPDSPGITAWTEPDLCDVSYQNVRDAMVADRGSDEAFLDELPTLEQLNAILPPSWTLTGSLTVAIKANLRALGFDMGSVTCDGTTAPYDAVISFNENLSFDFDSSDGITAGTFDFEGIVLHEIGHALGFISTVSWIDCVGAGQCQGSSIAVPLPLDLFRFRPGGWQPSFLSGQRVLTWGNQEPDQVTYQGVTGVPMSTGTYQGDGQDPSHWEWQLLSGSYAGIMDPFSIDGEYYLLSPNDIRAFDIIGWDAEAVDFSLSTSLEGVLGSCARWGDYDGDADLDLAVIGNNGSTRVARVYRNDGGGSFVDIAAGLVAVDDGMVDWGDGDNDGDLDLLVAGQSSAGPVALVYRNDGSDTFVEAATGLTGWSPASGGWGDYDNDGDLDVLLAGNGLVGLYRNEGGLAFIDAGSNLPVFYNRPGLDWGDYDGDGDLDILASGNSNIPLTRIFRNDGNAVFVEIDPGLPAMTQRCSADWGDYEGDGDLDILICGTLQAGLDRTYVYRNDGSDVFTEIEAGLYGVTSGSVQWGDFDNDGDRDILLLGGTSDGQSATLGLSRIYENHGNDVFEDTGATFANAHLGNATWGDADGDGDLDVVLTGLKTVSNVISPKGPVGLVCEIYDGDFVPANTMPTAPTNLVTTAGGGTVTFSWDPATDAETPQAGLTYNLRVGTTPGGSEIMSAMADPATGHRWIAAPGNAQHRTSWTLELPAGTYYWSVQAIDSAYAGSPFSDEQVHLGSIVVAELDVGLPGLVRGDAAWGDYDDDGDLDLLVCGEFGSGVSRIYRNDGNENFGDANAGLIDVTLGAVDWGDYDNDGDLDVLLTGDAGASPVSVIYRNDDGTFVDIEAGMVGTQTGDAAWVDYDNDGDLDAFVMGFSTTTIESKIYRNDGDDTFVDSGIVIGGTIQGSVAWGDYDGDGDQDLVVTGLASATIYQNVGSGSFVDAGVPLVGLTYSSVAWGDSDNDGDLDLLLTGWDGASPVSRVYRNDGGGSFLELVTGLRNLSHGSAAWGDLDNDGLPEIVLAGEDASGTPYTRIYHNGGNNEYAEIDAGLLALTEGHVAMGDCDRDADLDILVMGRNGPVSATRLIRNETVVANSAPMPPSGLTAGLSRSVATFSWSPAVDAQTPSSALTYNLRIGTSPGASDIMSAMSSPTGLRRIAWRGNAGHNTTWSISLPPSSVYHWAIQAVDTAYEASTFATGVLTTSFADVTAPPLDDPLDSQGATWVDHDGDGDLDLYHCNASVAASNRLSRNDGDGTFTDITTPVLRGPGSCSGASWADMDDDGDSDVYLVGNGTTNQLLRNLGDGAFEDVSTSPPGPSPLADVGNGQHAVWADFNGDGLLDLYLVNDGQPNRMFRRDGEYTNGFPRFVDITAAPLDDAGAGRSALCSDYDGDGDLDLYVANWAEPNKLFRNQGAFGFVDATTPTLEGGSPSNTRAGIWGDYDDDGCPDLYLVNTGHANQLLHNNCDETFTDVTAAPLDDDGAGQNATWSDYDNDGDLDLYLLNTSTAAKPYPNRLFRNDAAGAFVDLGESSIGLEGVNRGAVWGDADGDGALDLYVVRGGASDSENALLLNLATAGRHWLHLELVGSVSNRDAIGAKVRLMADGVSHYREVGGGGGRATQNARMVTFGLGSATTVDLLEIRWPSGVVNSFTEGIVIDRVLTVGESVGGATALPKPDVPHRSFGIRAAYPNPFNPRVRIEFDLRIPGAVDVAIYDVSGRRIRSLASRVTLAPGRHDVEWDGRDEDGRTVASGSYFCRLESQGEVDTRRVILLK